MSDLRKGADYPLRKDPRSNLVGSQEENFEERTEAADERRRDIIREMVRARCPQTQIAQALGISRSQLGAKYHAFMAECKLEAYTGVVNKLYDLAEGGDIQAIKLILQSGESDAFVPRKRIINTVSATQLSDEELLEKAIEVLGQAVGDSDVKAMLADLLNQ